MKRLLQVSQLQHVIRHRNSYLLLATISMVINVMLIIYLFRVIGHERIILLPPHVFKTFWVDGEHVSAEYLSEMGLFFINLRLNTTQSNAAFQHSILLRYIHPSYYPTIKSQFLKEEEKIKASHITLSFYPVNVQVDATKWIVRIQGDLQSIIGQDLQPSQRVMYQLSFTYDAGRLLLKSFEEVKGHA
jgi:conjugal transfer pilus assembly protein TraE